MSQAIRTRFIPWSNSKPNRYVAECGRGRRTFTESTLDHAFPGLSGLSGGADKYHRAAARLLCRAFITEDTKGQHPCPPEDNVWNCEFTSGGFEDGVCFHTFPDGTLATVPDIAPDHKWAHEILQGWDTIHAKVNTPGRRAL